MTEVRGTGQKFSGLGQKEKHSVKTGKKLSVLDIKASKQIANSNTSDQAFQTSYLTYTA